MGLITVDDDRIETDYALIKPPRKIRSEAMAVHHITNEMVSGAPHFSGASVTARLETHNHVDTVLVGHNITFDLAMLAKEGLTWHGGIIDTLRCSRHLIEEIDRFSLQYLRYELGLYKGEADEASALGLQETAHHALGDAFHVRRLHRYLNTMADDEELMALTLEPVLIRKFLFGKYKDHYLEEVAMNDAGYLHWMLGQNIDEDLQYSIKHYL